MHETRRPAISVAAIAMVLAAAVLASPIVQAAQAPCGKYPAATPALARLRAALAHGRFIAYEPTSLRIIDGHSTQADPESIRDDLKVLRARFDSLVTYGSIDGAAAIPALAAALGFRAVIIGIYDPFDETQLQAALAAAKSNPTVVVGLSLGNEMLFFHRHSFAEVEKLLDAVHSRAPQLPLATSEPFHMFHQPAAAPLLERSDFLLANVHPIFQPWFRAASAGDAAQFVVNVVSQLARGYCGPILVKETGIPTAPQAKGFTEKRQASFYEELQRRFPPSSESAFAYFSAFDAPWRLYDAGPAPGQDPQPEEAHWGLYDERRQPKPVVAQITPLGPDER